MNSIQVYFEVTMLNDLIEGIKGRLSAVFGESYRIYTEPAEQGFTGPCFFIALTEAGRNSVRGMSYEQNMTVSATYYPGTGETRSEMYSIGNRLFECMEMIPLADGDLLKGQEMKLRIEGNALVFSAVYRCRLLYQEEKTEMGTLEAKTRSQR